MEELKRQTRELDNDVKQLTAQVQRLNERADKTDRDKRWLIVGLLLVLALVGLIGFVTVRAERTAHEQEQLRSDVLCPLYGLILGSYDPDSRAPGAARDKYEQSYKVFRDGYRALHCTPDQIVPPRTDK